MEQLSSLKCEFAQLKCKQKALNPQSQTVKTDVTHPTQKFDKLSSPILKEQDNEDPKNRQEILTAHWTKELT